MRNIVIEIIDILYYISNMNRDCIQMIIDPIDTEEQAKRLLDYLEENKDNGEIMRVGHLLKYNYEIIGN